MSLEPAIRPHVRWMCFLLAFRTFRTFRTFCTFRTFRTFVLSWTLKGGSEFLKSWRWYHHHDFMNSSSAWTSLKSTKSTKSTKKYEKYKTTRRSTRAREVSDVTVEPANDHSVLCRYSLIESTVQQGQSSWRDGADQEDSRWDRPLLERLDVVKCFVNYDMDYPESVNWQRTKVS